MGLFGEMGFWGEIGEFRGGGGGGVDEEWRWGDEGE